MVALHLSGPLVGAAAAASTHACSDLLEPPTALWPYCILLLPPAVPGTTVAFGLASMAHFAMDIGWRRSVAMHLSLAALAVPSPTMASTLMCVYYLGIHVPPHFEAIWEKSRSMAVAMGTATLVAARALSGRRVLVLTDGMQRLVVSHAIVGARSPNLPRAETTL